MHINEYEREIVDFLSDTKYEDLPPDAIEGTKRCILDNWGVIAAGVGGKDIEKLHQYLRSEPNRPEATVFGRTEKLSAFNAIWLNAAMARAREFDDSHDESGEHMGAPVMAAGLGTAQYLGGVSGKDFLRAYALASEFVPRVRECPVRDGMPFFGFGANSYAPFSAAIMVASLMGLKGRDMYHALGWAYAQMAGAVQLQQGGSSCLHIHHGLAAATGFRAARLAQEGFPGTPDFLLGRFGVLNAYERGNYNLEPLTRDLGKTYAVANVGVKMYPSGRVTHTPIDAALAIRNREGFELDKVKQIKVKYTKGGFAMTCLPDADRHYPTNPQHAKFSLYYTVACALLRGHVNLTDFTEEAVNDPKIKAVIDKLVIDVDESIPMLLPGIIDAEMEDGSVIHEHVPYMHGSVHDPISYDEIKGKVATCLSFAGGCMSQYSADNIAAQIHNLENIADVTSVLL